MNPNISYAVWVTVMCRVGSLIVTNVSMWYGMFIVKEAMCQGQSGYMETLYFPFSFVVDLKLP